MKKDLSYAFKCILFMQIVLPVHLLAATTSTNLSDYVKVVESSSPQLQKAQAYLEEQKSKKTEARSAFMPQLTGSAMYLTNKKYALVDMNLGAGTSTVPQIVPTTQYGLSAKWNLFDGFASTYRYLSADENMQSANYEYLWSQFQTQRAAVATYYKALAAKLLKQVAEQNVKSLEDHQKDVESLKKAGVATEYELLRTQVMASDAHSELINAEDMVVVSNQKLNELVSSDAAQFEVTGDLPSIDESMLAKFNATKPSEKADLLALQKRVEALDDLQKSARQHWLPKLTAFADYNYYNNRNDKYNDFDNFRESYLIGLNLTWNLFEGFSSYSKNEQAYYQKAQLEKQYVITQKKSQNEIDQWKRKFLYFCSVYKAKNIDIKRSNEALRLAKLGRKAGTRTNTEILDAQADLYRSKAALINAQVGAIEALVSLELSSGQEIYSFIQ